MIIVEKAGELIAKSSEITLASINENGYPRICVLSKTKSEGIRKLWVSTGTNSVKVRHFIENPKASACICIDGNSITLLGRVSIMQDPIIKKEMWLDWFINHYSGGIDDPNYCILEFETIEATLWIDGEFVTVGGDQI
ncbi:MAG: pyridoxamine 5'-phosphate oxidase family protein [Gorillibacterium sp.]|nr:pyridoxamine 5'-phosphate oxidase family protein [Gorillibacterium sp.]